MTATIEHDMSSYTEDQKVALGMALQCFGNWGEGKFKGTLPEEEWRANYAEIMAPDAKFDMTGPSAPAFCVVELDSKPSMQEFMAFWDTFEWVDLKPHFFPGPPNSNMAFINMTAQLTRGGVSMPEDGMLRFMIDPETKLIKHMNFYFKNAALFDRTFGTDFTIGDQKPVQGQVAEEEAVTEPKKKKKGLCCAK